MSTEIVIGLVGFAVWLAYKAWQSDRFGSSGSYGLAWTIPGLTLCVAVAQLFLFAFPSKVNALPEPLVLIIVLTFFVLTPFIGVQTLAMLHIQGRLNVEGLDSYKMKAAFVCACLDFIMPLSILALGLTGNLRV